jgi:hypothetical protein
MREPDVQIGKSGMHPSNLSDHPSTGHTEIDVRGKAMRVSSAHIDRRTVIATGKWLKLAAVREEEPVDGDTVTHPESFLTELKECGRADLFNSGQRPPEETFEYMFLRSGTVFRTHTDSNLPRPQSWASLVCSP